MSTHCTQITTLIKIKHPFYHLFKTHYSLLVHGKHFFKKILNKGSLYNMYISVPGSKYTGFCKYYFTSYIFIFLYQLIVLLFQEVAMNGDHVWIDSNASGDLCYVGETDCSVSSLLSSLHMIILKTCIVT